MVPEKRAVEVLTKGKKSTFVELSIDLLDQSIHLLLSASIPLWSD